MEVKHNEASGRRPRGEREIDASLVSIDLQLYMTQIRNEKPWYESDRNAITVFKTDGCMSIVLIALYRGAEMKQHAAYGLMSIQVIEGEIKFSTDAEVVDLVKGQMLALHQGIPHCLRAKEETVFLLTITDKN